MDGRGAFGSLSAGLLGLWLLACSEGTSSPEDGAASGLADVSGAELGWISSPEDSQLGELPEPSPELPDAVVDLGACADGERVCRGAEELAVCELGVWQYASCSNVCAEQGVESLGCEDAACRCATPQQDCVADEGRCQGADILATCVDGEWKTTVCSLWCSEQGEASLGCGSDACQCTGAPPECELGETRCQGPQTLAACVEGQWLAEPCVESCAAQGLGSLGCDEALGGCQCSADPPDCVEDEHACVGDDSERSCVNGSWETLSCHALCGAQELISGGCAPETGACVCAPQPLCFAGSTQCLADNTLAVCAGDHWALLDCEERCASTGMISGGCSEEIEPHECLCTLPAECTDEVVCASTSSLKVCEDEAWVEHDCREACAFAGLPGGSCEGSMCRCLGDADPGCSECLKGACVDEIAACHLSPACGALAACLQACALADEACAFACWGAHATGLPSLAPALDCAASACGGVCASVPACVAGQTRCPSDQLAERCEQGAWEESDCAVTCFEQGLSSEGCSAGGCQCVFDDFECQHGEQACLSGEIWASCEWGQWTDSHSCSSECSAQGLVSGGCEEASCLCEAPCSVGDQRCNGEDLLQVCYVPSVWTERSCEQTCVLQGFYSLGCSFDAASGKEACRCVDDCGYCVAGACQAQDTACAANPHCQQWNDCDWQCFLLHIWDDTPYGLWACQDGCDAQFGDGKPLYQAWYSCMAANCSGPCSN